MDEIIHQNIAVEQLEILKKNSSFGICDQRKWSEIIPEEVLENIEFVLQSFYVVGEGSNIYRFAEGLKEAIDTGLPVYQMVYGVSKTKMYRKFIPLET